MPATYEPIATTTLGSAAASITFSSIPSTYTDLRIVGTQKGDYQDLTIRFNSDTAANYSRTSLNGNGNAASSGRVTGVTGIGSATAGTSSPSTGKIIGYFIDIFSYTGSTYKTLLWNKVFDQNGSGTVENLVGLWRSTSAISSITLDLNNADATQIGTVFTLYGIKAA